MAYSNQVVYVAEDHLLVAQGIASLLQEIGFTDIHLYTSGRDLYKACLAKKPDLVLLDIYMSDWDGISTLRELRENNFTMPCIMVTMIAEKKIIDNCMQLGANAYLHKSADRDEMTKALDSIHNNKTYISDKLLHTKEVKKIELSQSSFQFKEPLTAREKEILIHLCDGMSNAEIAAALFISPNTVETHKKKLLHKFGVSHVSKMIALSFKNKIV
jgi:two-component system, NarL family, response regulator DegU